MKKIRKKENKMDVIRKHFFPKEGPFELKLPEGSKLLSVKEQHGEPCLFIQGKAGIKNEIRKFHVFGTGGPMELEDLDYIGTFSLHEEDIIGHLYENPVDGVLNKRKSED